MTTMREPNYPMLYADTSLPSTNGWAARHDSAINFPKRNEEAIVLMLKGWADYAVTHEQRYESLIGEDGVLGEEWERLGKALRGLLNGETGRLDCGTLDGFILRTLARHGVSTDGY